METTTHPAVASAVVAACEDAWRAIQQRHPEVPDAVQVLGSGVERGRLVKLGHWWGGRWLADGQVRGEVLLAGEALHLPADQVFEVLLHEAAHGLNAARHIQDTSRGGRYHNANFQAAAEEVGLTVYLMQPYGWARTKLNIDAHLGYSDVIHRLGDAMRIARALDPRTLGRSGTGSDTDAEVTGGVDQEQQSREKKRGTPPAATCGCGRKMRMAPSVLAQGPVVCGLCGQEFTAGRELGSASQLMPAAFPVEPENAWNSSAEDAVRLDGIATLRRIGADPEGVLQLVRCGAWLERMRIGEPATFAETKADYEHATEMMRAVLKARGQLAPPAIHIEGREFLIGETVTMAPGDETHYDVAGYDLPPHGITGNIESIDRRGRIDIEFPAAGRYTVMSDSAAARALTHGYAELEPPRTPAIDLRQIPSIEIDDGLVSDIIEIPR